ncbi:MAG: hypothetical protein V4608_10885 [Bacteroidota bacterium]
MTAKEKANELFEKFYLIEDTNDIASMREDNSKSCALICVGEIIESLEITTGHCELRSLDWHEVQKDFQYWNDVKQQIELL